MIYKLSVQKKTNITILISIFFVMITYCKIHTLGFQMQWDDYWVVINQYTDKGLEEDNIISIFTNFYHGQYSPLNELYYIVIHELFEYNVNAFHMTSLLLHIFNTALVFIFINQVCINAFKKNFTNSNKIAFLTSILFGIHPINLEPVAWLAASKVLIYSSFYLLALLCYIQFIVTGTKKMFFLTFLYFIASFCAKEQAATLPASMLLLDFIFNRNLRSLNVWIEKIPVVCLSLFFGYITIISQGNSQIDDIDHYKIFQRIILAFYTLTEYFSKCILPIKLSYIYPFPFRPNQIIPSWLYIYPVTLCILIMIKAKHVLDNKWLSFGIGFFFIHIIVALHLIDLSRYSLIADRYAYLSSIGTSFLVAYGALTFDLNRDIKRTLYIALFGYVIYFGMYTTIHIQVWRDSKTLKYEVRRIIRNRRDYINLKQEHENKYAN